MVSIDQLQKCFASVSFESSSPTKSTSVYNLLLLGKSGVGKSTFINALHNYVTYNNIHDIQDLSQVQVSVPIAFEMSDDNGVPYEFKVGEEKNVDGNENLELDTKSGTRGCKSYKYQFDDITINIIDTPGLVDTEGIDKDKENMENILTYIGKYKTIHGICILLRPDEERLDDFLKYCIQELLGQLHCDAAANIIWIFTKGAASRYKLGSTGRAIRKMIEEIHDKNRKLNIPFSERNYFVFDNINFLYAVAKDKITFNEYDMESFRTSWDNSRQEFQRMMRYVVCIDPYDVRMSLSIHRVRELINNLYPLLQKITNNIIGKELQFQEKQSQVESFEGEIEELNKILFVDITELQTVHYDAPRFVCMSVNCRRETVVNNETLISYPQICRALNASIKETLANLPEDLKSKLLTANVATVLLAISELPAAVAAFCILTLVSGALWYLKGECSECGCLNKEHSITYYEVHDVLVRKECPSTKNELLQKTNDIAKTKEAFINFVEAELQPIHYEMSVVSEAMCRFAIFLKQTAIVPYSDAFPAYLKIQIKNAHGTEKAERLQEHLEKYLEKINFIETESVKKVTPGKIEPDQIDELVEQLKGLPINGPGINKAIGSMKNIQILNDFPGFDQFNAYEVHKQFF